VSSKFRAFVLNLSEGEPNWGVKNVKMSNLSEGEVTIRVAYSGVNYKDALVTNQLIQHKDPLIPGIDLAGTVIESLDERFKEGDPVIVTSYQLGVGHHGGFSEIARVPAEWVIPLPEGLTLKEAMILGTAGFTAALSVQQLEDSGITPDKGPILVTGATGGVGSIAVDILSKLGYEVVASTGKENEHDYLLKLGAAQIVNRNEVIATDDNTKNKRQLGNERWAGAVDPVGGKTLEYILTNLKYGGSVALSGLAGGIDVATTVYPFILRGIKLIGIDSVNYPIEPRKMLWKRLATDMKPKYLEETIYREISLEDLPEVLSVILEGHVRGRTLVKM
jgi:putative YhdH/YhfP family quinone oxidoreductase